MTKMAMTKTKMVMTKKLKHASLKNTRNEQKP